MKTLKVYTRSIFAAVCGIAEVFATILAALMLTGAGTIESRISGAIGTMISFLLTINVPNWLSWLTPAIHQLGVWLTYVPQWAMVALAIWGLFRALMAIHGHGALKALNEAIQELESSWTTRTRRVVGPATYAVGSASSAQAAVRRHSRAAERVAHQVDELTQTAHEAVQAVNGLSKNS